MFLSLLPVHDWCFQVNFPSCLGKHKVTVVPQGQGALQTPHAQQLLQAHWPQWGLSRFRRPTAQAVENRRKQSCGEAGPILIEVTKVNVTFGCQKESSGISPFNISVMRAVALEICTAGVSANSSLL